MAMRGRRPPGILPASPTSGSSPPLADGSQRVESVGMDTDALIEWFFSAAHQRAELELEARSLVTTWRWLAGSGNPFDPTPLWAVRRGIRPAKETRAGTPGTSSVPTLEVGLGADGQALLELSHAGGSATPFSKIWLPRPGGLVGVAFQQAAFGAPLSVAWLSLDGEARLVGTEVWGSTAGWSSAAPSSAERTAACQPPFVSHFRERYTWAEGRLVHVEVESLIPQFTFLQELEYGARGGVKVFQIDHGKRRPAGKA